MRVHIKTYGCTLNQADSDIMESALAAHGAAITGSANDADVVVVNTCTVKGITAQKILYRLGNMQKAGKKIVVTGCIVGANQDLIEEYAPSASIITTSNMQNIAEVVERMSNGQRMVMNRYRKFDRLMMFNPKESVIAKVPINDGCLSSCSFCETKFARGPLNSFAEDRILKAIEQSARIGAKEIQLTSQDMGAYGADRRTNIAELMQKMVMMEGNFKVRVGMLNPEHLHKYFDAFVEALKCERFYKFAHLPIQSGSNRVLRDMRRNYTVEEFDDYVKELRVKIPNVTVETDIIAGFPTETQGDFAETVEFVNRTRPEVTNMSRFAARPHASASKLAQHKVDTINQRSTELSRVVRQVQHQINDKFIGKRFDVLMTEANDDSLNGRNESYRQIVIGRNDANGIGIGATVSASVFAASSNVLYAR